MSISALGNQLLLQSPQNRLAADLEKNGLSPTTAAAVSKEIDAAVQSSSTDSSGRPDRTSVRANIDAKIKADVQSGTLTQEQADMVTKTLDAMDQKLSQQGGPPAGGPPVGGPPPGGGDQGGGESSSSSSKTEISESSVVSGGMKTTTVVYSDGSTETTTTYVGLESSLDTAQSLLKSGDNGNSEDAKKASAYLSNLLGLGLVDTQA